MPFTFAVVDVDGFFPLGEIDGAGKRREDDELGESEIGGVSQCGSGVEGGRFVARQTKDERTQNVNAVSAEILEPIDQRLAGEIEILVNIFQAVRRDRFHADQRSLDVAALRMASRNSPSSAASMVIWVKKTMSLGSFAKSDINSKRSARMVVQLFRLACSSALGQSQDRSR